MTRERNKYCRIADLGNEASVETFFVTRLLGDLGYGDNAILTKRAIEELKIPKGRKREPYRPDYVLVANRRPRWLVEAKAVHEQLETYTHQCAGYALLINRKYRERPLRHYMITNGILTRVYPWDQDEAVLSLRFSDFHNGNVKFEALKRLLSSDIVSAPVEEPAGESHLLVRPEIEAVKRAFIKCHRIIWQDEKMSPQAAFVAFAKLLFVKLWEDRRIRNDERYLALIGQGQPIPAEAVRFSSRWIAQQELDIPNPIDSILFRQLVEQIEQEIARKKRKRIFEQDDRVALEPGTIKRVVEVLEHQYLFGIDEDLNGRMFETFLAATMRGQELGQYFTPRSIVKLMVRLALPEASRRKVERVLDACCGTGGFIIEALTEMRQQVYENPSLSAQERKRLLDEIANEAIYGIDAARDPVLARVARINMYLHGDGGSRVYATDALQVPPRASEADPLEEREDVAELARALARGLLFDVIITNPPFSMKYSDDVPHGRELLRKYELTRFGLEGGTRATLESVLLFVERYAQILRPGGRLLTVIDDSILGGERYSFFRDFLRERFLVRAVISLHGDAFRGAGARVKTSVLYLERRASGEEASEQPDAFVYETRYVGLDDVVPKTPPSVAAAARELASKEIADVLGGFAAYRDGAREHSVDGTQLGDRLDAKFLRPWSVGQLKETWAAVGVSTARLGELVEPIDSPVRLEADRLYAFLKVTYEGQARRGENRLGREVTYNRVQETSENDIVVSHINAVNRATCVVPADMTGLLVSPEFTILRVRPDKRKAIDPFYLWHVLRSAAVVAEFLTSATGKGRHRVEWKQLRAQEIPMIPIDKQLSIGARYREMLEHERAASRIKAEADAQLEELALDGPEAVDRLERAKPPR